MLSWFLIPRAASLARLSKGKKRAIQELDNSLAEKTLLRQLLALSCKSSIRTSGYQSV